MIADLGPNPAMQDSGMSRREELALLAEGGIEAFLRRGVLLHAADLPAPCSPRQAGV